MRSVNDASADEGEVLLGMCDDSKFDGGAGFTVSGVVCVVEMTRLLMKGRCCWGCAVTAKLMGERCRCVLSDYAMTG